MKLIKKFKKVTFLCVLLVLIVTGLSGCRTDAKLNTSIIDQSQFVYNEQTDTTKVIWSTTLINNSIYDIQEFKVKFQLYSNSKIVKTETYSYDIELKHGDEYTGNFSFVETGKIDGIVFISWEANFDTFWKTYDIWLVVSIIVVALAFIAYTIFIFINEYNPVDVWDKIVDFVWISMSFLPFLVIMGVIFASIGYITIDTVIVLIVVGAILIFVALALLAHLVRFLICDVFDIIDFYDFVVAVKDIFRKNKVRHVEKAYSGSTKKVRVTYGEKDESVDEDYFDSEFEDVEDYLSDYEKLSCFTKAQLTDYCRENGISGYSTLKKEDLICLIMEQDQNTENQEQRSDKKENRTEINRNVSKIGFSDIAGLEKAKEAFYEKIIMPFEHRELFEKYGKKVGGGILLYGLPGTGKTMFAEACSNELNALFIPIKCSDIKSKWYGESEENVKKIFTKARKAARAIIFFDEFEAIGAKRTDNENNGNNDLVPQILAEMQGVGSSGDNATVMVIASTNKPWAIDSAFLRPGRFDEKIYIPLPDFNARKKLFELKLKNTPVESLNFDELATITDGYNGADITEFCEKLKMEAIKKTISSGKEHLITMEDVNNVKNKIKSSVSNEDVDQLRAFEARLS